MTSSQDTDKLCRVGKGLWKALNQNYLLHNWMQENGIKVPDDIPHPAHIGNTLTEAMNDHTGC
jgi:hypothetical protein